jgi:hypothetical protein
VDGLAPDRVRVADESLRDVFARHDKLEASLAGPAPLHEIVEEFGLTQLARMILRVVVAPHMWGEIAQLYGAVVNNPTRATVDEQLVRQLLGPALSPHQLAYELGPRRPLRRFGLIRTVSAEPRPFTALAPDPLIIARLRGEPLDRDPEGRLAITTAHLPIDQLRLPAPIARTLQEAIARPPARPLRIAVHGRDGSGRRALLAALAALAGRRLAIINLHYLDDPTGNGLRRALDRCMLAGWIPCIDGLDSVASDDRTRRERLRRTLAEVPGPLVLRMERDAHPPLDPGYVAVDLPDLSETERQEVWQRELAAHGVSSPADALGPLTTRWRIGPGTIHRVVALVTEGGAEQVTPEQIDRAVGQHVESKLGDVAERVGHLASLASLVLPADIMDSLTELLARLRLHRRVFEDWGMTRVASTNRGITALFQGPPGTGKTMVAGALARELGIELYRVDLSRIMSKWIGETERNLANVFSAAEDSQAFILFDEADSLFGKRTEVKSSNDRFTNLEVNYLLQRLDSFSGVAILTTNLGTAIDPAFKRRLAFRVHFPIPDEDQREQLWRAHLPASLPTADDLDLADLAHRYPLTGGSVRNCVMRAAFLAAAEDAPLSQEYLLRAVRLEYRAAGKLSESGPLE